jgi:hypothetical protein
MAIHDVDMDPVGTGGIDRAHLLAEFGKIGREDRWGDDERALHRILRGFNVRVTRRLRAGNAIAGGAEKRAAGSAMAASSHLLWMAGQIENLFISKAY